MTDPGIGTYVRYWLHYSNLASSFFKQFGAARKVRDDYEKQVIQHLQSNGMEKATIQIIKDGKIDSKDIPNLIVVIQRIYQFIYSLKNTKFDAKKRADITATSLKYLLHLLVLERKIKIDEEKQEEFFTQTDALIDSCIGLLSFPKSLKTKGCLKIFG